jgi:hypothetical protein
VIASSVVVGPATAEEEEVPNCAQIAFNDQETECKRVVVKRAYLPDGGFIDIHRAERECGPSGSFPLGYPLGVTGWLEPGWHEDITITLFSDVRCIEWEERDCLDEPTEMCAMPHENTTQERSFVHYCTDGEEDPPYSCPPDSDEMNDVVQDCATVTPRENE